MYLDTSMLRKVLERVLFNGRRKSVIEDCFKLTNTSGFSVYDGEIVEISYEEEVAVREEITEKFGGGSRYGFGEGAKLITVLAIIFFEIIIICGMVVPMIEKSQGAHLFQSLFVIAALVALPIIIVVKLTGSQKGKAELRESIASGSLEIIDYIVSDKLESSDNSGTIYYIFIGDAGIKASMSNYLSVSKGDKIRCAIVDGNGGRFIVLLGRSPEEGSTMNVKIKSAEELLNSLLRKNEKK